MTQASSGGAAALALKTAGARKRFGRVMALAGVDLAVPEGAVYALVGPNGAGKTTLLRALLGLTRLSAGDAWVWGWSSASEGARVRASAGYVPESHVMVHGWLRVPDLLALHARYRPTWDAGYAADLSRRFELRPEARCGALSKGQARRVQLVMTLAHAPPVLLLDEPTDGLDPVARQQARTALADHAARFPTTMLVSTHVVHELEGLADHVGVLRAGRLELQSSWDALRGRLKRYRLELPEGWAGDDAALAVGLNGCVVQRAGAGRERLWTVRGEPGEVSARLSEAGARVRAVDALTLEEAAVALLSAPAGGATGPDAGESDGATIPERAEVAS